MSCPDCGPKTRRGRWPLKWLGLAAALTVVGALAAVSPASEAGLEPKSPATGAIAIEVNDQGFSPSSVTIAPGPPVELEFTRTTEETCASSVVFPELGVSKELPLKQAVRIAVPADQRRTLSFQCGVGNHRSAVIIH